MLGKALNILKGINSNYSNLVLLLIALGALVYAYREYALKRRPVVIPEIVVEIKDDNWYFGLSLTNLGMAPAVARIDKAILKIGDETYPSEFPSPILLAGSGSPTSRQLVARIGHINPVGRRKIKGHEYRENRCEATIEIVSKAVGEKKFGYRSRFDYQIDVTGDTPVFRLVKEDVH